MVEYLMAWNFVIEPHIPFPNPIFLVDVCYGEEDGKNKVQIEQIILDAGGTITQSPTVSKTFAVISGKDEGLRVNNVKRKGNFDIVKTIWLHECLDAGARLPFLPEHLIFATPKTEKAVKALYDKYGDSYVKEVSVDELKALLMQPSWSSPESAKTNSACLVQEIETRYLADL